MKIPDRIFGRDREAELKKYLEAAAKKHEAPVQDERKIVPATDIQNPESYIVLEGQTYGNYSYSDLLVAMDKKHHGKNWYETFEDLDKEGAHMLTIRQYVDFLNLLKSGNVFSGAGNRVSSAILNKILYDILKVGGSYRAEWLDAKFRKQSKGILRKSELVIDYCHSIGNGQLQPKYSETLETCLMKDRTPGIYLASWLADATSQGLPPRDIKQGDLYYWHPIDGLVARFDAYSDRALLCCSRNPRYSNPELGVRSARAKI